METHRKQWVCCSESTRKPTTPFVTYRSTLAIRSLLYTDGVTEPQNASGDSFGDRKLEQVVRDNQCRPPSEVPEQLLSEIRVWQSASVAQQDDITLIVIDVFEQENCSKHDVGELAAEHCEKLVFPPQTSPRYQTRCRR